MAVPAPPPLPRCTTPGCRFLRHSDPKQIARIVEEKGTAAGGVCCGLCYERSLSGESPRHGRFCEGSTGGEGPRHGGSTETAEIRPCATPGCTYLRQSDPARILQQIREQGAPAAGDCCCGLCHETRNKRHGKRCQRQPAAAVVRPQAKAAARDPAVVKCVNDANRMESYLSVPMEYEVVAGGGVRVQGEPAKEGAPELGRLAQGSVVRGFSGDGWVRLAKGGVPPLAPELSGCWVPGADLRALCLRISVQKEFAEAVDVTWTGIPSAAHEVKYTLRWRARSHKGSVAHPRVKATGSTGRAVSGLEPRQPIKFCVVAALSLSGTVVEFSGPWSTVTPHTASEQDRADARLAHLDVDGIARGACPESGCSAWAASGGDDESARRRCARCGYLSGEHRPLDQLRLYPAPAVEEQKRAMEPTLRWRVVRESVDVLDFPTEGGQKVVTFEKDKMVTGYQHGPWLNIIWKKRSCFIRMEGGEGGAGPALVALPSGSKTSHGRNLGGKPPDAPAYLGEMPVGRPPRSDGPRHVFVCGEARSGTNLLADLLGMHSKLSPVYETGFVSDIVDLLDPDAPLLYPDFHKEVWRIVDTWQSNKQMYKPDKDPEEEYVHGLHHWHFSLDTLTRCTHRFLEEVRAETPALEACARFCDALFEEHRSLDGNKPRVVNKTPNYVYRLTILADGMYPEARVVHIIRDGRSVVHSILKRKTFRPENQQEAAERWADKVTTGMMFGLRNPDRYMELHYERLLGHPQAELSRVLKFLGEEDESKDMYRRWRHRGLRLKREKKTAWRNAPEEELMPLRSGSAEIALRRLGYLDTESDDPEEPEASEAEEEAGGEQRPVSEVAEAVEVDKGDTVEADKAETGCEDLEDEFVSAASDESAVDEKVPEPKELAGGSNAGLRAVVVGGD